MPVNNAKFCKAAEIRVITRISPHTFYDYGRSIMFHALGNHRAHGVALLVVLASSLSLADFTASDSQSLGIIVNSLEGYPGSFNGIRHSAQEQTGYLSTIASFPVSAISSDLFTIKQNLDANLNGDGTLYSLSLNDFIKLFNQKFFHGVDRYGTAVESNPATVSVFSSNGYSPFIEPGSSFNNSRTAQMAVTNVAETYWLEKIYDRLNTAGFGGLTLWGSVRPGQHFNYYSDLDLAYQDVLDLSSDPELHPYLWSDYGLWRLFAMMYLNTINPYSSTIYNPDLAEKLHDLQVDVLGFYDTRLSALPLAFDAQYGNAPLLEFFQASGIDIDSLNVTNFFSSDGSIENSDQAFTNSETSVFNKFATSFLPTGMFDPDEVNTNLFEYVDSNISETPTFNPADISGNGGNRGFRASSVDSFDYDFDDTSGEYDYDLINPLKTATDKVQHDTDLDYKFDQLAQLVNQRIVDIFQNPINIISTQPARWQAALIDKDMQKIEAYVNPQHSNSSDGVEFVCWCTEAMMFFGFFSFCVRRSLRVQQARDVASAI